MSKWLVSVVVATTACSTVIRPPDPDRRLAVKTQGTVFDADRGYRFVVLPEPGANLVRMNVRYPVGAIHDPPGKEGLAHLVEHLLTEVEVKRDDGATSLDAELGRVALSYNAYTSTDATTYEVTALPAALDDVLRVEGERLTIGCAGIPRTLFEREREVVRNELRQRLGGGGELRRDLHAALYPEGHPYRRVDSADTVAQLTYEDVCGFLVGPYRKGTPIVAIAGAVDVPAVQRAVGRHFTHVPKRLPAFDMAIPPAPVLGGTVTIDGAVDEPTLVIAWPLPPKASKEYRLLELVSWRIAGNLESYAAEFHWGHSARSEIIGGASAPVLAVTIKLDAAGDLDEAKARIGSALRDTFSQVARPSTEAKDPSWVHTWEAGAHDLLAEWESLAGRDELATQLVLEPGASLVSYVKELSTSTPSAVRELAETWFAESRARLVVIRPAGEVAIHGDGLGFGGHVDPHGVKVDRALADRPLPPLQTSLAIPTQRYTQRNGLTVVLAKGTGAPLATAELVIGAGDAHAPTGREGVAHIVGASAVHPDAMVFREHGLSTRIDELVESVSLELRRPGYGLTDNQKRYMLARLSHPRVVESTRFERDLLRALYGDAHPYNHPAYTVDGVKNLAHDAVEQWARAEIVPKNATLVLVGAFDPALVMRHVGYDLDQVAAGARAPVIDARASTDPTPVLGVTERASPTVELSAFFVGGNGVDEDHAKRLVLAAVLDAQLAQLREKRAITYGFSASYEPRRAGGLWVIGGDVDAARAAEAGRALVEILDDLRRDPDSYRGAFVLGRQKVLESLLVNLTSTTAVADRLAFLARFELPDNYYDRLAKEVGKLTLADLAAFVSSELDPSKQVLGAFGNDAPARAALAAAKQVKGGARAKPIDPFAE